MPTPTSHGSRIDRTRFVHQESTVGGVSPGATHNGRVTDQLLSARAVVMRDLEATGVASAETVSLLEDAVSERRWWAEQWPAGEPYVGGLVAQDVQDALLMRVGRWPVCPRCEDAVHALHIHPELGGPDPVWVCEESGAVVAALGQLSTDS